MGLDDEDIRTTENTDVFDGPADGGANPGAVDGGADGSADSGGKLREAFGTGSLTSGNVTGGVGAPGAEVVAGDENTSDAGA